MIGALLSDLATCPDVVGRIVVVDDHSTDATEAVAVGVLRSEVLPAPVLPGGWTGKAWACHQGVLALHDGHSPDNPRPQVEVEGSVPLVFLDADVRLPNGALALQPPAGTVRPRGSRVGATLARHGPPLRAALRGVQPGRDHGCRAGCTRRRHRCLRSRARHHGPRLPARGRTRRRARRGGRGPRAGPELPTCRAGRGGVRGRQDIRFRMYPDGPSQLFEGWTKNFALQWRYLAAVRLAGIVLWIAGLGSAAVALVSAAVRRTPLVGRDPGRTPPRWCRSGSCVRGWSCSVCSRPSCTRCCSRSSWPCSCSIRVVDVRPSAGHLAGPRHPARRAATLNVLVHLSDPIAVLVSSLVWLCIGLATGFALHSMPVPCFDHDTWLTRPRRFEDGGRWYQRRLHLRAGRTGCPNRACSSATASPNGTSPAARPSTSNGSSPRPDDGPKTCTGRAWSPARCSWCGARCGSVW